MFFILLGLSEAFSPSSLHPGSWKHIATAVMWGSLVWVEEAMKALTTFTRFLTQKCLLNKKNITNLQYSIALSKTERKNLSHGFNLISINVSFSSP